MKKPRAKPTKKRFVRKPSKQIPKRLSGGGPFYKKWIEFKKATRQGMKLREYPLDGEALSPYDHPKSYLKREIYRLVSQILDEKKEIQLESAIEFDAWPEKPGRISFKENPYHWAFFGFRETGDDYIKRYEVSRFGRQLLYARRHKIMPELLIGFLYQTGSPSVICAKASNPDTREAWYIAEIPIL